MQANIYTNINPSATSGGHYLITDTSAYVSFLNQNYLLKTINLPNYNFNSNQLSCKIDDTLTIDKCYEVTYICIDFGNNNYKFYYVENHVIQSGYVFFNLKLDLWATYLTKAQFNNILVKRCNRNIGIGVYDDIDLTAHDPIYTFNETFYNVDNFYIVCSIQYNVYQQVFGSNTITNTSLFAIKFKDIIDLLPDTTKSSWPVLMAISNVVGGIYQAGTNNAQVTGAWLVSGAYLNGLNPLTNTNVNLLSNIAVNFSSKSLAGGSSTALTIPAQLINPGTIDFKQKLQDVDVINTQLYVGTPNYNLKIIRTTQPTNDYTITTRFVYSGSKLQVLIIQGTNQQDITQGYAIEITTNNALNTGMQTMANSINTFSTIVKGAIAGYVKGGESGAIVGALIGGGLSVASKLAQQKALSSTIGSGDGLTTFNYNATYTSIPGSRWRIVYFSATPTEEAIKIRHVGATFNSYIASLSSILNYSLLGSGNYTTTFMTASLDVNNVPQEAKEFFENIFNQGVFIKALA